MKRLSTILAAGALIATFGLAMPQPAKADQQSTDVIIGAAALAAGIATYANVQHKNQLANTVQGYTPWGAAVYEDGHVVLPNGQSYYPGNVGQQIACNGNSCQILQNGIPVGYGGYGPGYNTGYYNGGYNNGYYNNNSGYYNNNGYYSTARRPAGTYAVVHPAGVTTAAYIPAAATRRAAVPVAVRAPINAAHPAAIEHVRAVRTVERDLGEHR
jgi:hypothetical protein